MHARSVLARKANLERRKNEPYHTLNDKANGEPAHSRLFRLWSCLETIDARLATEIARERPNLGLVKELSAVARSLQAQAVDLDPANGTAKRQPAAQAPELPEPTV